MGIMDGYHKMLVKISSTSISCMLGEVVGIV